MPEFFEISGPKQAYKFPKPGKEFFLFSGDPGHIWLQIMEDGRIKVGYDEWAANNTGKILFVRLLPEGRPVKQGRSFGTMETGKWVGPMVSPINGKLAEHNKGVLANPSLLNDDPYGDGWLAIIEPSNLEADLQNENILKDEESIKSYIESEIAKFEE